MSSVVAKGQPSSSATDTAPKISAVQTPVAATTDGFHLVIDALKLNGIDTVFGLPEFDHRFHAHGASRRLAGDSVWHEQNAGNAAAIAGFMTQKPGHLLDGVCARISQWLDRACQCDDQLLSDDSDQRLERTGDR